MREREMRSSERVKAVMIPEMPWVGARMKFINRWRRVETARSLKRWECEWLARMRLVRGLFIRRKKRGAKRRVKWEVAWGYLEEKRRWKMGGVIRHKTPTKSREMMTLMRILAIFLE